MTAASSFAWARTHSRLSGVAYGSTTMFPTDSSESRSDWQCPWLAAARAFHQHLIELAMIAAAEHHDFFPPGDGAGDAHRRHHRLGPGVAEGGALIAGQLANHLGDFAGQRRLRADREAVVELLADRLNDEIGRVAEEGLAIAVDEIDIFVAVDVPDPRTLRAGADDRIDHLLPFRAEARGRARIGEDLTILLRALFDPAVRRV